MALNKHAKEILEKYRGKIILLPTGDIFPNLGLNEIELKYEVYVKHKDNTYYNSNETIILDMYDLVGTDYLCKG